MASDGSDQTIEPRGSGASGGSSDSLDSELWIGDTCSMRPSVTQYRLENGRRYHAYKDGTYWAPNDEIQNENLDISHHRYLLLLDGKLLLAPVTKDIKNVLDLGTGTGIWAVDFADEFPDTKVIGTDLSPIQPSLVPPNCSFEIDDMRDEWTYPEDFFDLIHIRSLFGSIEDWPALYARAFKHLKPGGYIEHLELSVDLASDDGTLSPENPLSKCLQVFKEAGKITGQIFNVTDIMTQGIIEAGFSNVVEKLFKVPIGGWPADKKLREIGQWTLLGIDTGLEGYLLAILTRVFGWNTTETHVFIAHTRAATRDRKVHSYATAKVVYAQKPLAPTPPPDSVIINET